VVQKGFFCPDRGKKFFFVPIWEKFGYFAPIFAPNLLFFSNKNGKISDLKFRKSQKKTEI
jgi:hypothetical protein